jgi:hypothetical protein
MHPFAGEEDRRTHPGSYAWGRIAQCQLPRVLCPRVGSWCRGTALDHLQGNRDCPLDFAGDQHVKTARPALAFRTRLDGKLLTDGTCRKHGPRPIPPVAVVVATFAIHGGSNQ